MVLSLPFILALVGAGVGLLVGILIFGEVSDAIQCPATGGGGSQVTNVTSYNNLGTLGSAEDATYAESEVIVNFLPSITGRINEAVSQEGEDSLDENGEIHLGSTPSDWWFLSSKGAGDDKVSISFWIKGDIGLSINNDKPILSNAKIGESSDGIFLTIFSDPPFDHIKFRQKNNAINNLNTRFSQGSQYLAIPTDNGGWHLLTFSYDKSIAEDNTNMEYCLDGLTDNLSTLDEIEGCYGGNNPANVETCPGEFCFRQGGTIHNWVLINEPPPDSLIIGSDSDHSAGSIVTESTFSIDDLGIWNGYLLTHNDIDNLWNGGSGASISSLSISPSTLKGYWNFDDSSANGIGGGGGGSPEVGAEQCEQAKDTAWTVIGIMPVALFFGLFALFSSFQRPT